MRLLNAATRKLEVAPTPPPSYAILSHTWGDKEVIFEDFRQTPTALPKSEKIDGCCRQALKDGLRYIWIDTCCIDKNSSAELSEAINSMFQWYRMADLCYVYLTDVSQEGDISKPDSQFRNSRWFTRGWTLQELLAPNMIVFFDSSWCRIGEISRRYDAKLPIPSTKMLMSSIRDTTGIREEFIMGTESMQHASIAERMSWASKRQTTRVEDLAYSLLGIFDVNMPMLYGEGHKAFIRLQEEIIRQYDDHSLFAWGYQRRPASPGFGSAYLASSPADFAACGQVRVQKPRWGASKHYLNTNRGLSIDLNLFRLETGDCFARLNCSDPTRTELTDDRERRHYYLAMHLLPVPSEQNTFYRAQSTPPKVLSLSKFRDAPVSVYVAKSNPLIPWGSGIRLSRYSGGPLVEHETFPPNWSLMSGTVLRRRDDLSDQYTVILLRCEIERGYTFAIRLEYTFEPWSKINWFEVGIRPKSLECMVAKIPDSHSLFEILTEREDKTERKLEWLNDLNYGDLQVRLHVHRQKEEYRIVVNVDSVSGEIHD